MQTFPTRHRKRKEHEGLPRISYCSHIFRPIKYPNHFPLNLSSFPRPPFPAPSRDATRTVGSPARFASSSGRPAGCGRSTRSRSNQPS
jgi:hypothetical protein